MATTHGEFTPITSVDALPSFLQQNPRVSHAAIGSRKIIEVMRKELLGVDECGISTRPAASVYGRKEISVRAATNVSNRMAESNGVTVNASTTRNSSMMDSDEEDYDAATGGKKKSMSLTESMIKPPCAPKLGNTTYELEARMGTVMSDGKFKPGVTEEFFRNVLLVLHSYESWETSEAWTPIHDFFYRVPHSAEPDAPFDVVRTSTVFSKGDIKEVKHIIKNRVAKVDNCAVTNGVLYVPSIRAQVSTETDVIDDLPITCNPFLVRIKSRKTFICRSSDNGRGSAKWSFDLTMTYEGSTYEEAEKARSKPPTYEIEVELMDPENYLRNRDDLAVAASLFLKMQSILSPLYGEGASYHWLPVK